MRNSFYILLGLPLSYASGQSVYSLNSENDGETFMTCSGTFVDDGGLTSNYSPNITNRTITFCPDNDSRYLRIDFSALSIERDTDFLEVFFDADAEGEPDQILTGTEGSITIIADNPSECLTFRFNSDFDVESFGWVASISCITPCSEPVALFADDSTVNICYSDLSDRTISFDASASYSTDEFEIANYVWHWGDGSTTTTALPYMTHTFPNIPNWYNVRLEVLTSNTSSDIDGCRSTNSAIKTVRVLPPPTFEGSSISAAGICGGTVDLIGVAASQTIISNPPKRMGPNGALPDINSGIYESSIDVQGFFDPEQLITSTCLPEITIDIEHSAVDDLEIFLISPSGDEVKIFNGYGDAGISDNYFGSCVNESDGTGRGCPAVYHIVNTGGLDWTNSNALTSEATNCDIYNGTCGSNRDYYIPNVAYNASNTLNTLIGTEISGIWQLRIIDHNVENDGYLASWAIDFPSDCYSNMQHITPNLTDALWSNSGNGPSVPSEQDFTASEINTNGIDDCPDGTTCIGNQLANNITVGPFSSTGTYTYTFSVTDEYGCIHSYDVDIEIEEGEIVFDSLTDNYCKNDPSENLPTISDNGIHGVWNPNTIDTENIGDSTYTFTPVDSECAQPFELNIEIEPIPDLTDINFEN